MAQAEEGNLPLSHQLFHHAYGWQVEPSTELVFVDKLLLGKG